MTPVLQRGYQSMKRQIDFLVGSVLVSLGSGMLAQGLRSRRNSIRGDVTFPPIQCLVRPARPSLERTAAKVRIERNPTISISACQPQASGAEKGDPRAIVGLPNITLVAIFRTALFWAMGDYDGGVVTVRQDLAVDRIDRIEMAWM